MTSSGTLGALWSLVTCVVQSYIGWRLCVCRVAGQAGGQAGWAGPGALVGPGSHA